MKLKNKRTGEIGNFCYGYTNELCVSWQKDDGFWAKQEYTSLAELNREWEDYETFWYISPTGTPIKSTTSIYDQLEIYLMKRIGNYFETREDAEKAVEKLRAITRLKDKGFKVDLWDYDGGNYQERIRTGRILFTVKDYEENDKDLDLLFCTEDD